MSEPNANRDKLDQRVTNLESLFTHLEKTVSDLDGVVVDGHKKIEELFNFFVAINDDTVQIRYCFF